jgi:hypothetical protein
MRIAHLAGTVALLALLFCRLDGASAQGSDAARQACTPDAMRLCSDVIPDVARVTACMKRSTGSSANLAVLPCAARLPAQVAITGIITTIAIATIAADHAASPTAGRPQLLALAH